MVYVVDGFGELRCQLAHGVNGKLHEAFALALLMPKVAHRYENQEVVVGLSPLQEALTTGYIAHQIWCVSPNGVGGTHVHAGIEFPSGPRIVLGRIGCAMEEHVVDATHEHQIHVGFHLRKRGSEMFGEPCERFARREGLGVDVRSR